jgi:hypothetical protein
MKIRTFSQWEKGSDFFFLLNYLIYNDPLAYADLILNGEPEEYLKNTTGSHGLED